MPFQLEMSALTDLPGRCESLAAHDFSPLMDAWEDVLHDDNIFGALHGLDGDGVPLAPVTYRPKQVKKVDPAILPNNNLTSSHYRSLGGPPLAPRGLESRIVTNFRTSSARLPTSGEWVAIGAWEDVLDVKGRPFLRHHFSGSGRLPKRDLRGVRPTAVEKARAATLEYIRLVLASF